MKVSPLVLAVALAAVASAVMAPTIGDALGGLGAARAELASMRALAAAPDSGASVVVAGEALPAKTRAQANAALVARLRTLATRGGVLVERIAAVDDPGGLARVQLRVSGSEDAVIGLADAIERGTPLARLARWRIAADGAAVRLDSEVIAPWR